ncbi:DUF389 domain-containing protein [Ilumatobacter sp.]|uniref:DUF389 domain-containing protein n=1 Tax=Ilumatobacter sp. TaxID=1967498 RepID=UPI003C3F825D
MKLRWWATPAAWAVVALTIGVLVALTAPSSDRPPQRIGIALVIGGVVLIAFAARDRVRHLVPLGLVSLVGGGLLLMDGPRFIEPVTRGGGLVVLLVGLVATRFTVRRLGRLAGLVTCATFVGAAGLFVYFDKELLSLSLGAIGAFAVAVATVGLNRAGTAGEVGSSLGLTRVFVLGARAIGDRATNAETGEPIRDKVLYHGPDRQQRFFRFVILMGFASAIASLGVIADSTAVVIGAMLMAPLLIPLMGMSLSLVMGWADELKRAGLVATVGVGVAVGTGFLMTAILGPSTDVDANSEIASRISPTLLDLGIALAAGAAGAYALSRSDVSDALPGVAVAIALVPPLAVVGVTAQLGASGESLGALLLFGTNALAIVAMGALTFIVTGAAAAESARRWTLDWWTIAFGAIAVAVIAALVANTASINESDAVSERATAAVEEWIDERDYEILSIEIDGNDATVLLSGPSTPDDLDELGDAIDRVVQGAESINIRIAITEQTTLNIDDSP